MFHKQKYNQQYRLGVILSFGALLCAGTQNAFAKGLIPYLSPVSLLLLSEALTALFIILTFGFVPLLRKLYTLDCKTIAIAAFIGLINSALAPLLWYSGIRYTSAINASMIAPADILCFLIAGRLMLGERITKLQAVGAMAIVGGVMAINMSGAGGILGLNKGDALIFASVQVFAFGAILFKRYLADVMPELAIVIRNITGIAAVLAYSIFIPHPFVHEIGRFPLQQIALLIGFAFFSRYLSLTFYYESIERIPAITNAIIQTAIPLAGLVFAVLILGETVTAMHAVGGLFVVLGLAIETMSQATIQTWRTRIFGHQHSTSTPTRVTAYPELEQKVHA